MTRLRQMMLEELQRRNYSEITTRKYLQYVTAFARHFGKSPDQLGPNELRSYQAYLLRKRKITVGTAIDRVAALRFFFIKTLKRHQFREFLPYPKDRRRLPTVLSREEVSRGQLVADVKFAGGLLGHLEKGGHFNVEQRELLPGQWDLAFMEVDMKGKALFFKTIDVNEKEYRSDFRTVPDGLTLAEAADMLAKQVMIAANR